MAGDQAQVFQGIGGGRGIGVPANVHRPQESDRVVRPSIERRVVGHRDGPKFHSLKSVLMQEAKQLADVRAHGLEVEIQI